MGGNKNIVNKELIVIILGGSRNENAQDWKDAQDLSLQRFQNIIWRLAQMEKLTYHVKFYRGEIKQDKFMEVWNPLLASGAGDQLENGLKCWLV